MSATPITTVDQLVSAVRARGEQIVRDAPKHRANVRVRTIRPAGKHMPYVHVPRHRKAGVAS